jgi:hypothetical protein
MTEMQRLMASMDRRAGSFACSECDECVASVPLALARSIDPGGPFQSQLAEQHTHRRKSVAVPRRGPTGEWAVP